MSSQQSFSSTSLIPPTSIVSFTERPAIVPGSFFRILARSFLEISPSCTSSLLVTNLPTLLYKPVNKSPRPLPSFATISVTRRHASMPSFSGTWPLMERPALSSPPIKIFGCYKLAYVFKANRSFVHRHIVMSCHSIHKMTRCNTPCNTSVHAPYPYHIVKKQGNNIIGLNKCAVPVHYPKSVCITVKRKAKVIIAFFNLIYEHCKIFLARVRRPAAKGGVAIIVKDIDCAACVFQNPVYVAPSCAIHKVYPDLELCLSYSWHIYLLLKSLGIR